MHGRAHRSTHGLRGAAMRGSAWVTYGSPSGGAENMPVSQAARISTRVPSAAVIAMDRHSSVLFAMDVLRCCDTTSTAYPVVRSRLHPS
jgi:hypothetical protein